MSTASNGAATGAATTAPSRATRSVRTIVDAAPKAASAAAAAATTVAAPMVTSAASTVTATGRAWLAASKNVLGLSLDAYDAGVRSYLRSTTTMVQAGRTQWPLDLAENSARFLSTLASHSTAAVRGVAGS